MGAGEAKPVIQGCAPYVGVSDPLLTLWDQSPTVVPYDDSEDDISLCGIIALHRREKKRRASSERDREELQDTSQPRKARHGRGSYSIPCRVQRLAAPGGAWVEIHRGHPLIVRL